MRPNVKVLRSTVALGCLAAVTSMSCAGDPVTEIVLEIDSNLTVPGEMDAIRVEVTRGGDGSASADGGAAALDRTWTLGPGAMEVQLPAALGILPDGVPQDFTVEVSGLKSGVPVIWRRATTGFVPGQIHKLRIELNRDCVGMRCPGQTCVGGACQNVARIDPKTLPPWMGQLGRSEGGVSSDGALDGAADLVEAASDMPDVAADMLEAAADMLEAAADMLEAAADLVEVPSDLPDTAPDVVDAGVGDAPGADAGPDAVTDPALGADMPPKLSNGSACTMAGECDSGFCVDLRCCATACNGLCQACNVGSGGTCSPVTGGEDPDSCVSPRSCDVTGVCKKDLGQGCAGGAECLSGFCTDSVCCNSLCDATCRSCTLTPETMGTCSVILTGEDPDSCLGANTCASGMCKKKQGQTCSAAAECATGVCADGYCCNTACGSCGTCAANPPGTCLLYAANTDPENLCGLAFCNGGPDCPANCGYTTCSSGCKPGAFCDGVGPGVCRAKKSAGASCLYSCECVSNDCSSNACY